MTPKTAVIILANLMDEKANLNDETRARVELGCMTAVEQDADVVVFIGWDYREDCDVPISVAMRDHALHHNLIPRSKCVVNTLSRDTVGDAVLSRAHFGPLADNLSVTVVTSDYHADRTRYLFETVWGKDRIIEVLGAETPEPDRRATEVKSMEAFDKTFAGVNFDDFTEVQQRLLTDHPFYNGEMMPSRSFPQTRLMVLANLPFDDC